MYSYRPADPGPDPSPDLGGCWVRTDLGPDLGPRLVYLLYMMAGIFELFQQGSVKDKG